MNLQKGKLHWRIIIFTILLYCFTMFTSCSKSPEESVESEKFEDSLSTYLETVMQRFQIPGLTIAIIQEGKPLYVKAFGVTNVETEDKMKPEHIFHFASVSKPFVATAVMQLVEQGKINLDQKLVFYLPYFELDDDRYKTITIRQMLNHTSGIPDVRDYEWDKPQYDEGAAERYVRSLKNQKMLFNPGTQVRYSNMAFDILGDVIAKVSGQSFEDYITDSILDPLQMKESSFLINEISVDLRTAPHVWQLWPVVSEFYPYNRRHAPSSTLNSSVIEMMNWAQANLNKGELNGTRILGTDSYNILWKNSITFTDETQIGLSWFLGDYRGIQTVGHGGGDTGYSSNITLLPDKQIGIIIASNYDATPMGSINDGVLDILFSHKPQPSKLSIAMRIAETFDNEGIDAAKTLYYKLKNEAEQDYSFGHWELNRLGYFYMGNREIQKAIEILKFNVELFPDIANTYDSLGEAYMIAGQNEKAIANYEKSVELDPNNANGIEMLKKLKNRN
jgi:CubicO group peptidase (beta-lactamase class C family)